MKLNCAALIIFTLFCTQRTHSIEPFPFTSEQSTWPTTNLQTFFLGLELPIHFCLIHTDDCFYPLTYSDLKKHYTESFPMEKCTQCPVLLRGGIQCSYTQHFNRPIKVMYHAIKTHHGVRNICPFAPCEKKNQKFHSLQHSINQSHPELISANNMFICPACQTEICCPSDLISVFNHYKPKSETCSSGLKKPK